MGAHHFRAGFSFWEKHGTGIIERNAGDLVNESTRGSHTFTCPALFFPTFVSSMREDLRVAALCFHLHAFGFRERLDEADEGRGEMMTRRLDQIPRETFIPKSLPIPRWSDRFARRMIGVVPFEYWSRRVEYDTSSMKRLQWIDIRDGNFRKR